MCFIADAHSGSKYALWPEKIVLEDGAVRHSSPAQLQILDYWLDFWRHEAKDAQYVFLLGDMCQGSNYKETGRGTTTPELELQVDAMVTLLQAQLKPGQILAGVSGSRYHNALDLSLDKLVLERCGGKYLGKLRHVRLAPVGKILQLAHGVGGGALYSGTITDRESLLLDVAEARSKLPWHTDMIVRAHLHHFWYHRDTSRSVLRLPCWQTWYPWDGIIGNYGKKQSDIGGVCVDFGDRGSVVVKERLYTPPKIDDGLDEL